MTFKEKIENSEIVIFALKFKDNRIKSKKSRIIGILFTTILIAFTVMLNILKISTFDKNLLYDATLTVDEIVVMSSLLAVVIKIILTFIKSFIVKSYFQYNHMVTYEILEIVLNLSLVVILLSNLYNYYTVLEIGSSWDLKKPFIENFINIFISDPRNMFMLIVTLVINVPVLFKFLYFFIKNIFTFINSFICTLFFPITLYRYLTCDNRVFYEFVDMDEQFFKVNKRVINDPKYGRQVFLKKLIAVLLIAIFYFLIMLSVTDLFVEKVTTEVFFTKYFPFILLFCYTIALLRALEIRMHSIVRKQYNYLKSGYIPKEKDYD